jgi:tetratricopeptide (TPR) repeat protein/transcriptional regulator with XRE-family HTH domain
MTDDVAAFGALLQDRRQSAMLSQAELASRSGLSIRAVSNLERGRTRWPHPDSVRRLAHALDLHGGERDEFLAAARRRLTRPADDALRAGPGSAAAGAVVPRQLPAAVREFAGRRGELELLSGLLDEAGAVRPAVVISAIGGMAGIGKTTLAVHWAHRVASQFPDGQLYVNLRGFHPSGQPADPADALRGFLDALNVPGGRMPASLEAQAALYRSMTAGRRMLIVLDNARDAEQVRPLLPGGSGCLVVVTSRIQLTGLAAIEGARQLTLDVLSEAEAREFLRLRLGAARLDAEPGAAGELIRLCGRLPLALAIAAARVSGRSRLPIGALSAELTDARHRLDALDTADEAASVRAVFSWSLSRLPAPAAGLFGLLGLHPGPDLTIPAAASLAGLPLPAARRALGLLAGAHLITEPVPGRFGLHDLLRAYAAEQARASGDGARRRAAIGRMLGYYVRASCAAAVRLNPAREPPTSLRVPGRAPGLSPAPGPDAGQQALAWYEAELETLLAVTRQAAQGGFDAETCLLAWSLADFLDRRGRWRDWVLTQEAALTAARRLGDDALQARTERGLGRACTELGLLAEARAHLKRALALSRKLADGAGQANTYLAMATVSEYQGAYDQALEQVERALGLLEEAGDKTGQARALNGVGWFHAQLGHHSEALHYCERALALYQQTEDRRGAAATSDSIGLALQLLGRHAEAIAAYRACLEMHHEAGDLANESETLSRLGDCCRAIGDDAGARAAWERALAILDGSLRPVAAGGRGTIDAAPLRAKLQQLAAGGPASGRRPGEPGEQAPAPRPG